MFWTQTESDPRHWRRWRQIFSAISLLFIIACRRLVLPGIKNFVYDTEASLVSRSDSSSIDIYMY